MTVLLYYFAIPIVQQEKGKKEVKLTVSSKFLPHIFPNTTVQKFRKNQGCIE